jgi:Poly(R)-hydroxyalkanoic acid synthase subunit (PHA_synth_III_E)
MDERFRDPLFLQRILSEYAQGFAALAGAFRTPAGPAAADFGAIQQSLVAGYQRLFTPGALSAAMPPSGSGAAFERYQRAAARTTEIAESIAHDASRRMAAALGASGPEAPPITSLRELHALWIECGEAAYADAARLEEFATAQAELLMALVELRAAAA